MWLKALNNIKIGFRIDKGYKRFIVWAVVASGLSLLLYQDQVVVLVSKGSGILSGNIGSTYPLGGLFLVAVFLILRWRDLHQILLKENGLTSRAKIRLLGLLLVITPMAFAQYAKGSIPISAVILVMVWYGTSLMINPSTLKMLLPYLLLYVIAILSPIIITSTVGEPLANVASFFTGIILNIMGIPVLLEGREVEFVSQIGGTLRVDISPGCSSVSSITIFLLLCGLMHLDLKKDLFSTIKLASLGVIALIILNALRIAILIWSGYSWGIEAMWGLHVWLGYAIFTGFYAVALILYFGMGHPLKTKVFGDDSGSY